MADATGVTVVAVDGGVPTIRKTRVIGQQQQIVRLDYEDVSRPSAGAAARVRDLALEHLKTADVVVISDYAKGLLTAAIAREVIAAAAAARCPVVIDPRPEHREFYHGCDYITPNWRESRALLRWPEVDPTPDAVQETARALARELSTNVVLTLGPHGMRFCSRDASEEFSMPTLAREVFDVSGAGDTVVAAFALARAVGISHERAVAIANQAASIVVGKFGTATVSPSEMVRTSGDQRLVGRADLAALGTGLRAKGQRLVTINGSFDVLHAGHLHILREARRQGEVLLVGLNSDASVRRYKGADRPVVPEAQRAEMLLALRTVDFVHIFDEADPIVFIETVRPDVHVNGAEYGTACVEAEAVREVGARLHLVDRVPGLSTSGLFDAIRRTTATAR
jgi:D-beta-D-heptose 7-phosphate kinase/D-beta-D-heptose 1-phosphate adenosyltransferase